MSFATPSDADRVAAGFASWIATNLAGAGVEYEGLPGAPAYTSATEWPVFIGPEMPPTPHRCIVVTPTTETRVRATIEQGLQVRVRGLHTGDVGANVFQVRACAQAIFDLTQPNGFPAVHVPMGTFTAGQVLARGRTPIPPDDRGRPGFAENFVIRYRKPLPLDGPPTYIPIPPPEVSASLLDQHIADLTPHPAYDGTVDLVEAVEEEYL